MVRGLAAAAVATCVVGCGEEAFPTPPTGVLLSDAAVRAGEELYRKNCAICHGPSGHGDGPQAKSLTPAPADLRNLSGARADRGYWFLRIKKGGKEGPLARERSAMPAWGDHLTDEELWQVVAFLDALAEDRS